MQTIFTNDEKYAKGEKAPAMDKMVDDMVKATSADGCLYMEGLIYDNLPESIYRCTMEWDENKVKVFKRDMGKILEDLDEIAMLKGEYKKLPKHLEETFNTYYAAFWTMEGVTAKMEKVRKKAAEGEPLTKKEEEVLQAYKELEYARAEEVLPGCAYGRIAIRRAMRYVRLVELRAPDSTLRTEICEFVKAQILSRFASKVKEFVPKEENGEDQ